MSLGENVEALQREADGLEERCRAREREVRITAVEAEAELAAVEAALADEESRLAVFSAELREAPARVVLTPLRSLVAAGALGGFVWGAISSGVDVTKLSVGLFVATWVAFLAGALRGK